MLSIINIIILIYLNDSSIYRFSKHRVTTCCRYFESVYYHRLMISEVYQEIFNDKCKSGVEVYVMFKRNINDGHATTLRHISIRYYNLHNLEYFCDYINNQVKSSRNRGDS